MESLCQKTLDQYLASRRDELRPTTMRHYQLHVGSLIKFLHLRYPEVASFSKLRRDPHIEGWLQMLCETSYTVLTQRQIIFYVRRFLKDIQKWRWPESPPGPPPRIFVGRDLPPKPFLKEKEKKKATTPKKRSDSPSRDVPLETRFHGAFKRYLDIRGATLRPATLQHYRLDILSLIRFLRRRFPDVDCFSKIVRFPHIEGWLEDLAKAQPRYSNGHRRERIRNVGRFLEDMHQ